MIDFYHLNHYLHGYQRCFISEQLSENSIQEIGGSLTGDDSNYRMGIDALSPITATRSLSLIKL
jgi:hypothetical protein